MTTFEPEKKIINDALSETFIDIINNYDDYGLDKNNILLQDIAFILKQSFKLNETTVYIDSKRRSILTFIKITYGNLKTYIQQYTNCECVETNNIWRCVIPEDT